MLALPKFAPNILTNEFAAWGAGPALKVAPFTMALIAGTGGAEAPQVGVRIAGKPAPTDGHRLIPRGRIDGNGEDNLVVSRRASKKSPA